MGWGANSSNRFRSLRTSSGSGVPAAPKLPPNPPAAPPWGAPKPPAAGAKVGAPNVGVTAAPNAPGVPADAPKGCTGGVHV